MQDVLFDNFSPGTLDGLGLGPAVLRARNPRLVYGQGTGYGTSGLARDNVAMDLTVQAHMGVMDVTGFPSSPPVKAGVAFMDFMAGVHLYAAIVTALVEAQRTGEGRVVEIAMAEACLCAPTSRLERCGPPVIDGLLLLDIVSPTLASNQDGYYKTGAASRTANEHNSGTMVPYNVYRCADEPDGSEAYFAIILMSPRHWPALCATMGREDLLEDERYSTNGRRVRNKESLEAEITAWTRSHRKHELALMAKAAGFPGAAVRSMDEVVHDEL